jgi:hypothetical protein
MKHIVVNQQQAEAIRTAGRSIQVLDASGKIVGFIKPAPPEEEINRVKARIAEGPKGPLYSSEQVFEHLRSLDRS